MIAIPETWNCPNCGEASEIQFKRCWNCGADREGRPDPHFDIESRTQTKTEQRVSWALGFAWLTAWLVFCAMVLTAAVTLESWLSSFWSARISLAAVLLLMCLLTAVFVNILSRLYLWIRDYLYADQPGDPEVRQRPGSKHELLQLKSPPRNE